MNTPLQKAAQAAIANSDEFYALYKRTVTSGCIPVCELKFVAAQKELRKALDAELQQAVEPVAWRWGILPDSPLMKRKGQKSGVYLENPKDIGIDVNGVKSLENYKWTPLYLHPPQPQATTSLPAEVLEAIRRSGHALVKTKFGYRLNFIGAATAQGEKP